MAFSNDTVSKIELGLVKSGFQIINSIFLNDFNVHKIIIKSNIEITVYAYLKKITSSGWSNKTNVRRVQISKLDMSKLVKSTLNETAIIIGYQDIFEKTIYVAWNVYKYIAHKTNRSCYVNASSLFKAFIDGYFTTTDLSQKVWVSDEKNLNKLLYDYMKYNATITED